MELDLLGNGMCLARGHALYAMGGFFNLNIRYCRQNNVRKVSFGFPAPTLPVLYERGGPVQAVSANFFSPVCFKEYHYHAHFQEISHFIRDGLGGPLR